MTSSRIALTCLIAASFAACSLVGCGGSPSGESGAASSGGGAAPSASSGANAAADGGESRRAGEGADGQVVVENGHKFIDMGEGRRIPYDVFFADPLAVAANRDQVAVATPAGGDPLVTKPPAEPADSPSGDDKPAAAGASWDEVIPINVVDAEVKQIRNSLMQSMQSVGKYNGNYKEIQIEGATLAAMAQIAIEHSGDLSWKENAKYVREYGKQMGEAADGLGRSKYEATEMPYQNLIGTLNGNLPAELPTDVADRIPFGESADRGGLMKRMDKAFEWMRKNVGTEEIFKDEAERISHEGAVLAALSKVIATEGYTSADEMEYATYAKEMITAAGQLEESVKSANFAGFNEALNVVKKKCDECHVDYRFAGDF